MKKLIKTQKEIKNRANIKALKKARICKGLTRNNLASRLGVSSKAIEKFENGRDFIKVLATCTALRDIK